MSWQQNVVLQRPVGPPKRREERPYTAPNGNSGDSSILRYIKTLTSHQTNAKQQRMDRYLRQVKHPQPADERVAIGPKSLPTTANKHQPFAKSLVATAAPASQLQKKNGPPKVLQHEPKARSDRSSQGKTAGRKSKGRPQAKRQYEGAQSRQQRKKVKETPTNQQNTGIGSLDRFRLHGTWSQDKTQTATTAKREPRPATVQSAECKEALLPAQGSSDRAQGTMKSRFWPSVATSGQCVGPQVPLGPFRSYTLGTSEDPPSKPTRLLDDDSSLPTLKGIAIGNGVVSTSAWVESAIPFLKSYNYGYQFLGSNEEDLQHSSDLFSSAIANCRRGGNLRYSSSDGVSSDCAEALQRFNEIASRAASSVFNLGRNVYDIRRECHQEDELHLCYRFSRLQDFVNTAATKAYFNEASHNWKLCSSGASGELAPLDHLEESESNVARALAHGVRVLVYGGDADTVVNWMSQDSWTRALAWEHQPAFTAADFEDVNFQGQTIGRVRTSHGFSFMKVYGAGHMVPHDQPATSYEMVRSFLYDAPGEGMFS
ncbi:hypothetical protein PF004_g2444 [Phytophthora fragariae]|uniref:Carboxypeptidase n=1 Tax=Phytophthora fragariae TaxID=53985 RepID=A0A6A3LT87_9STRA|nr:hypothetical protein PF011_g4985 [Phytophthora fragariae]KAE9251502.1 hypothetical protein PF004_g2444 [Phytophthora fragariae]